MLDRGYKCRKALLGSSCAARLTISGSTPDEHCRRWIPGVVQIVGSIPSTAALINGLNPWVT